MKQYPTRNPQLINWLGGIAVGAVAMYLADPAQGKRRRSLVQEKMRTASGRTSGALQRVMHDTGERMSSAQYRAKNLLKRNALDDEGLQWRVRSAVRKLARLPDEVEIKAEQGCVTLTGLVSEKEKDRLLQKLRRMPGIRELRDRLEARAAPEVRAGWFRRERPHKAILAEDRSSPAPGNAATHGLATTAAATRSAASRLPIAPLLAVAGLGYAIRSLGKGSKARPKKSSRSSAPHSVHLQKSIEIQASPETVFNIWSKYDNFPQFMSRLVDIHNQGGQHAHWVMQGPAGVNLEWDAVLTKYMEPTMLAWKTEPGAPIEHNGSVRFESSNGGTRATVRMFYGPGAGSTGMLNALLGSDPEQELEADLERMKNFIEGKNLPRELTRPVSSSGQVLH